MDVEGEREGGEMGEGNSGAWGGGNEEDTEDSEDEEDQDNEDEEDKDEEDKEDSDEDQDGMSGRGTNIDDDVPLASCRRRRTTATLWRKSTTHNARPTGTASSESESLECRWATLKISSEL